MNKLILILLFGLLCFLTSVNSEIMEFGKGSVIVYVIAEKPVTITLSGTTYRINRVNELEWVINDELIREVTHPVRLKNGATFSYLGMKDSLYKVKVEADVAWIFIVNDVYPRNQIS